MSRETKIPVALAKRARYHQPDVSRTVHSLLDAIGCRPPHGAKVLVKPNLLAPVPPDYLPCTHPSVVRAVCQYLLDFGARLKLGDSPTFGRGAGIARMIGLTEALADLPVAIVDLDKPKLVRLSFGGRTAISRVALESDLIMNLPKLKVHHQVRITGAVKNVYGCVSGLIKPCLHLLYGDRGGRFERMILEIWENLPPSYSLIDAITAMHVWGPTNGQPYALGLLGASGSPVALDSAVMNILGLEPEQAPLWQMSVALNLPGARLEDLVYPMEQPGSFEVNGFKMPECLFPMSFRPLKVVGHWLKRARESRALKPRI